MISISKLLFGCVLIVFFLFTVCFPAYAQTTQVIESQVKLSVCGDANIEGPEDCEGVDLGGSSCETEGFMSGTLSCTVSCDFDTAECVPFPPTPTPSPSPSATPTSAPSSTDNSTAQQSAPSSITATTTETTEELVEIVAALTEFFSIQGQDGTETKPVLPEKVRELIGSETGLSLSGLKEILEKFAVFWRQSLVNPSAVSKNELCDLDGDGLCDIIDLSVLLYYVEVK